MSNKYEIKNIVGTFNPSKLQKLASHVLESGHPSPRYCTSQVDGLSASDRVSYRYSAGSISVI